MYKLLLSWRYLRSRYIALASIISVTLGVATMIIVNSVMAGFTAEMHERLHGILSDIVFESHGMEGLPDAEGHIMEIRKIVGDDLEGVTPTARVPAMIHFRVRGQGVTQQIMLIGIDQETYAQVSDFSKYLLHSENRQQLSFLLRHDGYDSKLPTSGWRHRRLSISAERAYQEQLRLMESSSTPRPPAEKLSSQQAEANSSQGNQDFQVAGASAGAADQNQKTLAPPADLSFGAAGSSAGASDSAAKASFSAVDPYSSQGNSEDLFDPMQEQFTGIVLGISIVSQRFRNPNTQKVEDFYLTRPGDDVQIFFPSTGTPPKPLASNFTVVDLYESKMSEYDSSFAFVPLKQLQKMRNMIDPVTGAEMVTSIQIKLKEGADLNAVRDRLQARFPPDRYPYRIQTWRDLQGPLLAAVQMETTILNILLFLIIAVAGFGILATFFMIVVEKTKDIGVMKSLGAPSQGVMAIFLGYGVSLGAVGSGAGMVLGLLFVHYINEIAAGLEVVTGKEIFDPTVYYFQKIPTSIDAITILSIVGGAVFIAVLASVLPALRAARLHPVEALRYE